MKTAIFFCLALAAAGVQAAPSVIGAELGRRTLPKAAGMSSSNAAFAWVAAHAAFAAPGRIASVKLVNPPQAWGEAVEKGDRVPFAAVVNGALRLYDWKDLVVGK